NVVDHVAGPRRGSGEVPDPDARKSADRGRESPAAGQVERVRGMGEITVSVDTRDQSWSFLTEIPGHEGPAIGHELSAVGRKRGGRTPARQPPPRDGRAAREVPYPPRAMA